MAGRRTNNKRPASLPANVITETSAGGVVFKRTPTGVRLALVLDPYAKWTFAKGHVEKGESLAQAAVRETEEEMGLSGLKVVAPLGRIELWFRDRYRPETKGSLIHKYVHFFLMEAPTHAKGRPQRSEKIRRVIWVGLRRVMAQSSYRDVLPMLVKMRRLLRERGVLAPTDGAMAVSPPPVTAPTVASTRSPAAKHSLPGNKHRRHRRRRRFRERIIQKSSK
ncbi:MAG: NUDIX domain-containing protein [Patescibacteria group bacterium]|nr:NUDIX domain-containing protein [Patescibacteria group bacterium]